MSTTYATVDSNGLATAVSAGSTVISATLGTISGSTTLTVTTATLVSIDVTADDGTSDPSIAFGTQQNFIATGTYSDNNTVNLTASVIWSSSSTTVAAVDSNGLATAVSAGTTTISATLGTISGSTTLTVNPASVTLVSIALTPTDPSVSFALPEQFYATGTYSDGSTQDLTGLATWVSSDTHVATISDAAASKGLATPVAPGGGTTTITAWFGGISGSTTLTVTPATLSSITISSATTTIALGTTQQFFATGNFSDGTTQDITASVLWTSSDSAVATISITGPTTGLATAVGAGTTTITAALGLVTNTATLTVTNATLSTITISPGTPATIFLGASAQFTATGNFNDGSTQDLTAQVTWRSSNKTIATVSNTTGSKGLVTPLRTGTTTISATLPGTIVTGSTTLSVSSATLISIDVTPASASMQVRKTQQFTATGNYAGGITQDLTKSSNLTWSSSNTAVAKIANVPKKNKGLATGVSTGTVTITAHWRAGAVPNGTASLTVTP